MRPYDAKVVSFMHRRPETPEWIRAAVAKKTAPVEVELPKPLPTKMKRLR